ncbi:MAG: Hsp20/alpha crystallin family protein [Thermoproteota archaeon]|nr:Hsp20/alpha crystallin family protein [Thermoproteota archaeon]
MRRRVRDTDDEPQEEEEEKSSNDSLRGWVGPRGKREGGRRERGRRRRWNYMTPFSGSSFGLAPEDWLREFDEMRHEMEHVFEETIQDIERIPKELVREYQTAGGGMAREIGPLVYGYSYTVGADGKPQFREFGNIRPSQRSLGGGRPGVGGPMLSAEREPLADVTTTDKGVKVTVEMPGINKQDIKVSAYEGAVEVSTIEKARRKYHRIIDLPSETDIETARSTYSNGILEIIFDKKAPPRGREIKVD